MAIPFDKKELETDGSLFPTYGKFADGPYLPVTRLNTPITPRENFLRFMRHEAYEWIPDPFSDYFDITPSSNLDNQARGYAGGVDAFGVTWEALENGLPAMIRPGNPLLKEISDWPSISLPEPEKWGLEKEAAGYLANVDHTRAFRARIQTGLFERLISVMPFEDAAVALITEPEEVIGFLEKVTEYNLKLIDSFIRDYEVDTILLLDDWASQLQPFFSERTAREVLAPFIKQMADRVHAAGLPFMLHSCGNGTKHIPVWIDAGVDVWQFQPRAVNVDEAIKLAGNKLMLEGYWLMPAGMDEKQQEEYMEQIVERYGGSGQVFISFCDSSFMTTPFIRNKMYELGRRAACRRFHGA